MLDYDAGDYDFAEEAQAYREASKPAPAQLSPEMLGEEDRRAIRFVVPAIRSRLVELEDDLLDLDGIAYTPAERAEVVRTYKRAIKAIDRLLAD